MSEIKEQNNTTDNFIEKNKRKKMPLVFWWCLQVFSLILALAGILAGALVRWLFQTWPDLNLTELMYQMNSPIQGTGKALLRDGILQCGIPAVIGLALLILLTVWSGRAHKLPVTSAAILLTSCLAIACSYTVVAGKLDVQEYLRNQRRYSDFIDGQYVAPESVAIIFPEQKKNLIYIYLESMESTFAHMEGEGGEAVNYIPELTGLAKDNISFSNTDEFGGARSTEYTTWTIGAIFAQSSGLPLKTDMRENDMNQQTDFFPPLTCIGDILEAEGYQQAFLCGSDLTFGGRDKFLEEHGNYQKKDYYWAVQEGLLDEDYYVWWGYEDRKLFTYAKKILKELSSGDAPFNLTILTADTHFEDGYLCEECEDTYSDRYANVLACSSRQVAAFLRWAEAQDWYENTTIVLVGDHPTMDKNFCKEVQEKDRAVYNCILNSSVKTGNTKNREFSTLDLFPTTLAAMGCTIEGDRLGLGVNLFSDQETLLEKWGPGKVDREFRRRSQMFEHLNQEYEAWEYWKKTDEGWKYYLTQEGRYAQSEWVTYSYTMGGISEKTFFFDDSGYAVFGWAMIDDVWYYIDKNNGVVDSPEEDPPQRTVGLVYYSRKEPELQCLWQRKPADQETPFKIPFKEILNEHDK